MGGNFAFCTSSQSSDTASLYAKVFKDRGKYRHTVDRTIPDAVGFVGLPKCCSVWIIWDVC